MLRRKEGMNMTEQTTYVPQEEDFVLVPKKAENDTAAEAVTGVKHEALKRFFAQKSAWAGIIILGILILMAIIGPYLSGHGYDEQNLDRANLPPRIPGLASMGIADGSRTLRDGTVQNKYEELNITDTYYIFGTDSLGRDMFSRCFMGIRISLLIAVIATVINLAIGMNYGMISGYFGGMPDILMQRVVEVIGSIPTLVVVTLMMLILQPGMGAIIIALMISGWIDMSVIARAEVMRVKEYEFIQAARTIGAGHGHILFREILPNITGKMVTQIMLSIPTAVFLEAFLSFVGLGMPPGTCSLGTMLTDGFKNVLLYPYQLFPAAIEMILIMIGCYLVAGSVKKSNE